MTSAYRQLPAGVTGPLNQLVGWALWLALLACLAWLIASAGRLWMTYRRGELFSDAAHGAVMSLLGAIVASSAAAIATATLTPF
jgi:hypothetical protein